MLPRLSVTLEANASIASTTASLASPTESGIGEAASDRTAGPWYDVRGGEDNLPINMGIGVADRFSGYRHMSLLS